MAGHAAINNDAPAQAAPDAVAVEESRSGSHHDRHLLAMACDPARRGAARIYADESPGRRRLRQAEKNQVMDMTPCSAGPDSADDADAIAIALCHGRRRVFEWEE